MPCPGSQTEERRSPTEASIAGLRSPDGEETRPLATRCAIGLVGVVVVMVVVVLLGVLLSLEADTWLGF